VPGTESCQSEKRTTKEGCQNVSKLRTQWKMYKAAQIEKVNCPFASLSAYRGDYVEKCTRFLHSVFNGTILWLIFTKCIARTHNGKVVSVCQSPCFFYGTQ